MIPESVIRRVRGNAASLDIRRAWLASAFSLLGLLLLVALESTDWDRGLARLAFDPATNRFPLRDNALLNGLSHDTVKVAAALTFAWILISVWWPIGMLTRLPRANRVYLLASVAVSLVVVASLKRTSAIHCPWDLAEFGGTLPYLRLFDPVPRDWLRGACFPAGHVLSAFAFIGGFFAWRPVDNRIARRWLAVVLIAGAGAALGQQMRGAHFLTHSLWSLWWCWTLSTLLAWLTSGRLRPINVSAVDSD